MSPARCLFFTACVFIMSCSHTHSSWQRAGQAAHDAALHPSVWAPLAGAAVFAVDDLDDRTVNHLSDHTPLFGDQDSAKDASDDLKSALMISAGVSAFMAPAPAGDNYLVHSAEHLAVAMAGVGVAGGLTDVIKDASDRQRPNGENDKSFPSGHASQSFAAATLASANVHRAWGDSHAARWADAGLYTAASLTAYARVEAEKHHPSDVLVGASLGNFVARFLDQLLLEDESAVSLTGFVNDKSLVVGIQYGF